MKKTASIANQHLLFKHLGLGFILFFATAVHRAEAYSSCQDIFARPNSRLENLEKQSLAVLTNPFIEGQSLHFAAEDYQTSKVYQIKRHDQDTIFYFNGNSGNPAVLHLPDSAGQIKSVLLRSSTDELFKAGKSLGGMLDPFQIISAEVSGFSHAFVIDHLDSLFALQFVAESKQDAVWKVALTTDESEALSIKLGKKVTYEASFRAPLTASYVTLAMGKFRPHADGLLLDQLPGLGDENYPKQKLLLTSVALSPLPESGSQSSKSIRIFNSSFDFGFTFALDYESAMSALHDLGQKVVESARDKSFWKIFTENDKHDVISRPGFNLLDFSMHLKNVVNVMMRLRGKRMISPVGGDFLKLGSDAEREEYLNRELKRRDPNRNWLVSGSLLGKVSIGHIWQEVGIFETIPTEAPGVFGTLHGRYSHIFQILSYLDEASEEERQSLKVVLVLRTTFPIIWNLLFENRAGGRLDPASQRVFETP